MTAPERVARFLARLEAVTPGRTVIWSDPSDRAVALLLDDLRALLVAPVEAALPVPAPVLEENPA